METETKIVIPPIIVEKQDVFGRKEFGEYLLNLISQSGDELIMSLDGKRGEGKTTFVKMWRGMLDKKGIPNIYINAFENDYSDDAFIAIAGVIEAYIEEHENKDEVNPGNFKKKVKIFRGNFLSLMVNVVINLITNGAMKNKDELFEKFATAADDFFGKKLQLYKKDKEIIQSFKRLVSKMLTSINSKEDNLLVIIIDEIDCCNPTYALDIIKKVKRLSPVENVVFVLVMDRDQLKESVKLVHGQSIDAHTYLQKFINKESTLPKRTDKHPNSDIAEYNRQLFDIYINKTWEYSFDILEFLESLSIHFDLSLHQIDKVYINLKDFYVLSEGKGKFAQILSFLAVIKVIEPSVYEALLHQRITYEELREKTRLSDDSKSKDQNERKLQVIAMYLKFSLIAESDFGSLAHDPRAEWFCELLYNYDISREDLIPFLAKKLSDLTVA